MTIIIGLVISMPLVIFGSSLILKILNRLPILIWAGGALLGYIAGEVLVTDPAIQPMLHSAEWLHRAAPIVGATKVEHLDPYVYSLDDLRKRILQLVGSRT